MQTLPSSTIQTGEFYIRLSHSAKLAKIGDQNPVDAAPYSFGMLKVH